jgi:hypothetical protein
VVVTNTGNVPTGPVAAAVTGHFRIVTDGGGADPGTSRPDIAADDS